MTATDLKLPSPRASTSLSWLPVRITASLGTTSRGSPCPVRMLTLANILGFRNSSGLAKRSRTLRVRVAASRVG
ncbi:hypothetical protein D3C78_1938040 [compost metagenome]